MKVFDYQCEWGRFETWTEKPSVELLHTHQTHSINIVSKDECLTTTEADGMIFKRDEIPPMSALAIKTADCMPILILGKDDCVFLHAGWKGLAIGILKQPQIAQIRPIYAFIGPSIHSCCFEVSEDFHHHFSGSPYFEKSGEKYFFNLQAEAYAQLHSQFPDLRIEIAPQCTCCDNTFHSYRRDKTSNRNWNLFFKG
mgnify:CR=1 FL=1